MQKVRTRIAPSPTGYLHIGNARTALFNFLFARHQGGTFILRLEDTDKERSRKEYADDIFEQFEWLGLTADETYIQSEHVARHRDLLHKLVSEDKAYISSEPAKDDAARTVEVVRLRNPGQIITFEDMIRGAITFDTTELKDFVIARSIDEPLYHFAVVADDDEAGITHVIRGEDHISNTPRQILIQEALGYERPLYAHFPLHLAADRSKLSKRKGDVAVRSYREKGFLPEAIFNYLAMLGWTPPSQKEIMTIDEMIAEFDLHDLHRSAAVFDLEKLRWFNRQYVERMNEDDFTAYALPVFKRMIEERGVGYDETIAQKLVPLLRERISVPDDIGEMVAEGEFDFFFAEPKLDVARIPEKKSTTDEACEHLAYARQTLADISGWSPEAIKQALWEYASEKGRGAVLWPLRYALSGRDKSPDPFLIASIIGRDRTLKRIEHALASTSQ